MFNSISLLAYIIVAKYGDGIPLYRLENVFERSVVELTLSTMAQWIISLESKYSPLLQRVRLVKTVALIYKSMKPARKFLKEPGKRPNLTSQCG